MNTVLQKYTRRFEQWICVYHSLLSTGMLNRNPNQTWANTPLRFSMHFEGDYKINPHLYIAPNYYPVDPQVKVLGISSFCGICIHFCWFRRAKCGKHGDEFSRSVLRRQNWQKSPPVLCIHTHSPQLTLNWHMSCTCALRVGWSFLVVHITSKSHGSTRS